MAVGDGIAVVLLVVVVGSAIAVTVRVSRLAEVCAPALVCVLGTAKACDPGAAKVVVTVIAYNTDESFFPLLVIVVSFCINDAAVVTLGWGVKLELVHSQRAPT